MKMRRRLASALCPSMGESWGSRLRTNCTLHCSMAWALADCPARASKIRRIRGCVTAGKNSKGMHEPRTAGTIEQAVSGLDGFVDDVGGNFVADLPETEAHLGHVIATIELDVGNRNHFEVVACAWATCLRESLFAEVLARLRRQQDGLAVQGVIVPQNRRLTRRVRGGEWCEGDAVQEQINQPSKGAGGIYTGRIRR